MHVRVAVTARVADDDGLGPVDVFEILGEAKQDGLHSTFGLQASYLVLVTSERQASSASFDAKSRNMLPMAVLPSFADGRTNGRRT